MTEQKVKTELIRILRSVRDDGWLLGKYSIEDYPPNNTYPAQILVLLKQAGYVRLAEDQSLPPNPYFDSISYPELTEKCFAYDKAKQDMLKANFRKVEL